MAPVLDAVASEHPDVRFETVRVDEHADVVARHRVRATPTVLALDGDGNELARLVGGQSRSTLDQLFALARASLGQTASMAAPVADRRADVAVRLGAGGALAAAGLALGMQPVLLVLGLVIAASAALALRPVGRRRSVAHSSS